MNISFYKIVSGGDPPLEKRRSIMISNGDGTWRLYEGLLACFVFEVRDRKRLDREKAERRLAKLEHIRARRLAAEKSRTTDVGAPSPQPTRQFMGHIEFRIMQAVDQMHQTLQRIDQRFERIESRLDAHEQQSDR